MIYVPDKFRPKHPFPYPADNHTEFERWYYENHPLGREDREYLPIFWTAYYCRHKFGQHKPAMVDLQKFLDSLDRSKRYYTIVQYDNGIQHNLKDLDIMVFSMSGGRTDYPLPLISQKHDYYHMPVKRRYLYNFIGNLTHPVREELVKLTYNPGALIRTTKHSIQAFCSVLMQSTFTLCPRGFGPTSFRIQEALQYGSIPVYISDEFVIPHNVPFENYGVTVEAKDVHRLHEVLSSIPSGEIKRKQEAIPHIYDQYFTYKGNQKLIHQAVNSVLKPLGTS